MDVPLSAVRAVVEAALAEDIARTIEAGAEIAIVVGGGNFVRGEEIVVRKQQGA